MGDIVVIDNVRYRRSEAARRGLLGADKADEGNTPVDEPETPETGDDGADKADEAVTKVDEPTTTKVREPETVKRGRGRQASDSK